MMLRLLLLLMMVVMMDVRRRAQEYGGEEGAARDGFFRSCLGSRPKIARGRAAPPAPRRGPAVEAWPSPPPTQGTSGAPRAAADSPRRRRELWRAHGGVAPRSGGGACALREAERRGGAPPWRHGAKGRGRPPPRQHPAVVRVLAPRR